MGNKNWEPISFLACFLDFPGSGHFLLNQGWVKIERVDSSLIILNTGSCQISHNFKRKEQ